MQVVGQTASRSGLIASDDVPDRQEDARADPIVCNALHLAVLTVHLTAAWHAGVVTAQSAMEALHSAIGDMGRTASRRRAGPRGPVDERDLNFGAEANRRRSARRAVAGAESPAQGFLQLSSEHRRDGRPTGMSQTETREGRKADAIQAQ
jgi:hypothetical protein